MKTPAKVPIKTAIRDMYDDVELSTEQLDYFRQVELSADAEPEHKRQRAFKPSRLLRVAMVANIVLASFLGWFVLSNYWPAGNTDQIVADVIDNHLSYKTMKYQAYSLNELGQRFSHLGFMLSSSDPIEAVRAKLIGARPCLILNIPAAQLRYQVNDHQWVTVFQTRYQRSIYGNIPDINAAQSPIIEVKSGVKVSLWQENGLLFAMAQPN